LVVFVCMRVCVCVCCVGVMGQDDRLTKAATIRYQQHSTTISTNISSSSSSSIIHTAHLRFWGVVLGREEEAVAEPAARVKVVPAEHEDFRHALGEGGALCRDCFVCVCVCVCVCGAKCGVKGKKVSRKACCDVLGFVGWPHV
jgi:hypothetical protein